VKAIFAHDNCLRCNSKERFEVAEYCLSESWIRVPMYKTVDRKGKPITTKLKGAFEAFYR
jgi:hypothetical protein